MSKFKYFFYCIIIFFVIISFHSCQNRIKNDKPYITVSILPQKYFVKRISGDNFDINVLIPPGASPAVYEPTLKQIKELSLSKLYFRIGYIPFEQTWMSKIIDSNKHMRIINTAEGVNLIKADHHHHSGKGIDPHIWLSPKAVKIQAQNILNALVEMDPDKKLFFQKNYDLFIKKINELDYKIDESLKNIAQRKFVVFHPTWTYFARDYNLEQIPIEIEGKSPSPNDIKTVIDTAKREKIKIIFIQKQFDTDSAEVIADEINGKVIALDPLAENWLENMEKIAVIFKEVLK